MRNNFKKVLPLMLAAGAALVQVSPVIAADTPAMPEAAMYLYNHDCEDLTLGADVGVGAYLSSTFNVMDRVVAAPETDASNGKSIKVTAQAGAENFYKIFTNENTWLDGDEKAEYPADYNNEVIVSFDVYREEGQRTPNFTIQNVNMSNLTLAAGFIDKNGTLSVALSKTSKSLGSEEASGSVTFHKYDKALEANKWHNISIVYNKIEEKTLWYANGEYVCDAPLPTENETYINKKGFIYSLQCFALVNEKNAASAYIDNIKIAYAKPQTTKEIQEVLYADEAMSGWTVTTSTITSTKYDFSKTISEVKKNYMVEFDFEADTVYAKGACIFLENAANNALASAYMANEEGSLIVRTEMTPAQQSGAPQSDFRNYAGYAIKTLNDKKLFHVRDAFRANERTNFKFYVDVNEHVVYYYVNDVYAGKTLANPDYNMIPARMKFLLPANNETRERKFRVYNMKVGYTEAGAVEVSGLDVVDESGYQIDGAEVFAADGVNAYVKARVTNDTSKDINLMFVIVQYNGEQMIDTEIVSKTVGAGAEVEIDQNSADACSLVISPEVTSIKAFVWDADGSLMPYCDGVEAVPNIM